MRIMMTTILLMLATQAISGEEDQPGVYKATQPTERGNTFADDDYYRHLSLGAVCGGAQRDEPWADRASLQVRSVQNKSAVFLTRCVW